MKDKKRHLQVVTSVFISTIFHKSLIMTYLSMEQIRKKNMQLIVSSVYVARIILLLIMLRHYISLSFQKQLVKKLKSLPIRNFLHSLNMQKTRKNHKLMLEMIVL